MMEKLLIEDEWKEQVIKRKDGVYLYHPFGALGTISNGTRKLEFKPTDKGVADKFELFAKLEKEMEKILNKNPKATTERKYEFGVSGFNPLVVYIQIRNYLR